MPEKHLTWDNLADFYHRKTGGSIVEAHDQQVRKGPCNDAQAQKGYSSPGRRSRAREQ
jgi:hypothetical protein